MPPVLARVLLPSMLLATVLAGCGGGNAPPTASPLGAVSATPLPAATPSACARTITPPASPGPPLGPRSNLPAGAPVGQWATNFTVVAPGILARGGTPDEPGFTWLKAHGWKSVVDVRTTDDTTYSGFVNQHFGYLWLPVGSGLAPTPDQARSFLCFAAGLANQPIFVHDNSGAERVGMFVALYRYAEQGWPMPLAVQESKLYGELSLEQLTFLQAWSTQYPPGTTP